MSRFFAFALVIAASAFSGLAAAQEICGDGLDNDASGGTDEGCNPAAVTGVCEQPLCHSVGAIAPLSGALVHERPADVTVRPHGPELVFRRTYVGRYVPRDGALPQGLATFTQPMGPRWHHNYMSWIADAPGAAVVVHIPGALDVLYTQATSDATWDYYTPQAGHAVRHLRQHHATLRWELEYLSGRIHEYGWDAAAGLGKLDRIRQVGHTTGITLQYGSNGQIAKVLDAAGTRWLEFAYATGGARLLTAVKLMFDPSSPETQTAVRLAYGPGSRLANVAMGAGETPAIKESYTYDAGGDLTALSEGTAVAHGWKYRTSGGQKRVARASAKGGTMAIAYGVCAAGKGNYHYSRRTKTVSCTSDVSCGAGAFCGGVDDAGAGQCFAARACVVHDNPSEPVPTVVSPSCAGCAPTLEYAWDTSVAGNGLVLRARKHANGRWTSYARGVEPHGLPHKVVRLDIDPDAANEPSDAVVEHLFYSADCPGRVTERRIHSELATGACDRVADGACKRTIRTYDADCRVDTVREKGFTYDQTGAVVPYDYLWDFDFDSKGRLERADHPGGGGFVLTYWADGGDQDYPESNGLLREIKHRKAAGSYLTTLYDHYTPWGTAGREKDPAGHVTEYAYHFATGKLSVVRRIVPGGDNEWTGFAHFLDGRPLSITFPEGNCQLYHYDADKRLSGITATDFDGSNCSESGEKLAFAFDADGNRTTVERKDAAGTVEYRELYTYDAAGRLRTIGNPVTPPYFQEVLFNGHGQLFAQRFEDVGATGARTELDYTAGKLEHVRRFTSPGSSDDTSVTPGKYVSLPTRTRDEQSKGLDLVWDDMGRQVLEKTDGVTTIHVWDGASNLIKTVRGQGTAQQQITRYSHDLMGRVTAVDTADAPCGGVGGPEIQYTHDALPAGVTCPSGSTCGNLAGRLAVAKVQLSCDSVCAAGSDCRFDRTTYSSYGVPGRLTEETVQDDGGPPQRIGYAYTKNGRVRRIDYPGGGGTWSVEYRYGRGDAIASNDDSIVAVERGTVDKTTLLDQVSYHPFGPLEGYRQQNGLCQGTPCTFGKIRASFTRNVAYRLRAIHAKSEHASPQDVFKITYAEDVRGRYTSRDFLSGKDAFYRYDALSRVLCRTTWATADCPGLGGPGLSETMTYDSSDDRTTFTLSYPAAAFTVNRVPGTDMIASITRGAQGTIVYTNDALGNRVSDDDSLYSGDTRIYSYDARSNLVSVEGRHRAGPNKLNPYVATFAYDHRNRRIFKSFTDEETDLQAQWSYTWDQLDRLLQVKHVPNVADPTKYSVLVWYWLEERPFLYYQLDYPGGAVSRRYLCSDEQGRPQAAWSWPTAQASTTKVWQADHGLFGWDVPTVGDAIFQPLRMPGQLYDRETEAFGVAGGIGVSFARPGISDNRFRAYDPFTGTFLQIDPLATLTGDSYGYAGQNPVMASDPLGLSDEVEIPGIEVEVHQTAPCPEHSGPSLSAQCECEGNFIGIYSMGPDAHLLECAPSVGTPNASDPNDSDPNQEPYNPIPGGPGGISEVVEEAEKMKKEIQRIRAECQARVSSGEISPDRCMPEKEKTTLEKGICVGGVLSAIGGVILVAAGPAGWATLAGGFITAAGSGMTVAGDCL